MQAIIKSQTYRQFRQWCIEHNRDKELVDQVRSNVIRTYEMLVHCWAEQINAAGAVTALSTNSESLGKALSLSPRTIRRHLGKLEKAELIRKTFRGSTANYHITFINIDFIAWGVKLDLSALEDFENAAMTQVADNKWTKSPHISNYPQYRNKENSNVEMSQGQSTHPTSSSGDISEVTIDETGNMDRQQSECQDMQDMDGQNARGEDFGRASADFLNESHSAADFAHIISYVVALWQFAAAHIFSTLPFLLESQKTAAQQFFFSQLSQLPKNERLTKFAELQTRLRMVANYLERHPGKYVQPPEKYFDPGNPNGFAGTIKWMERQRDFQAEVEKEKMNTKKLKAFRDTMREYQRQPDTSAFIKCRNRLAKIHPDLSRAFQEEVIKQPVNA